MSLFCVLMSGCSQFEFGCTSGQCVPLAWRCDGETDCLDGTDEKHCSRTCQPDQFLCHTGDQCIQHQQLCDGTPDCRDASDESVDNCGEQHLLSLVKETVKMSWIKRFLEDEYYWNEMDLRVCRIWHQLIVNLGIVTKVCVKPPAVLFSTEETHCSDVWIILTHVSRSLWMNDYTDPCDVIACVCVHCVVYQVFFSSAGSTWIPPCPGSFSCDNRTCVNVSRVCNGIPDCPRGEDEILCG